MQNRINTDTLNQLIVRYRDDAEMLKLITDALENFEKYHQAIYRLEVQRRLYAQGAMSAETYRELIPDLDSVRTRNHNALLSDVKLLNRLAEQDGLLPFCEGTVSEEHPFRTWVADAVLAFVRQVIEDRVTGGYITSK